MGYSIHRFAETTSTQDEARRLLHDGRAKRGDVIVADTQTAGRGRFGRSWQSATGGLYATFLVDPDPLIAIRSGVAVAQALETAGLAVRLKWPNDVVVREAKLAGILIETADGTALVGVGVNLTEVPIDGATSIAALGATIRRGELTIAIHRELHARRTAAELLAAYRGHSTTIGRRVCIVPNGTADAITGQAIDIDDEGHLIIETPAGPRSVSFGECRHASDGDASNEESQFSR